MIAEVVAGTRREPPRRRLLVLPPHHLREHEPLLHRLARARTGVRMDRERALEQGPRVDEIALRRSLVGVEVSLASAFTASFTAMTVN